MFFSNSSRASLAIIAASFLWGTTGTAANFASDLSPLAVGAFSMGVGGLLLVVTSVDSLKSDIKTIVAHPKLLLLGSLAIALYPLSFYTSMHLSGVAIGTVLSIATAPFFSVIFERLFNKKKPSKKWLLSFLFGAIGIVLLTIGKQHPPLLENTYLTYYLGLLLGLIAGLSYATYSWVGKQIIDKGVSAKSAMASMFGFGATILLPTLFFTGDNLFVSNTNIAVVFYMAIIPMFLGYLLFGYALHYIQASEATLITLLEPVIATLLAVTVVGESFSLIGWLGMVMISLCLVLQISPWSMIIRFLSRSILKLSSYG